jgi:hypothetical protein
MDLSPHWDYIVATAAQRLENNKTQRHVSRYGEEIEVLGAAGELAARLTFGLAPNLHTNFDTGVDLFWAGRRVDVKTTRLTPRLHRRALQWPQWKPIRSDIILMMAVDLRTKQAIAVGYTIKDRLEVAPVNVDRDIPCREIYTRDLYPVWYLFAKGAVHQFNGGTKECLQV